MSEILLAAQRKAEDRARCKADRMFLAHALGYDFFQPETHAELFAQYPEFFPVDEIPWVEQVKASQNVLVLWPRGHLKTTAVVVLCVQAILCNPDIRILLMQGSLKVTKTLLKQIAAHFTGDAFGSRLKELFPEFCGTKKQLQLSFESFTTPARQRKQLAQATVTVASPKSVKTGQHYDLGIFDDLVNDQNYKSDAQLKKVEEDFNMAQPLIDPGCPKFVSGTRYAFDDLYEQIMKRNTGEWVVSLKTCWLEDGVSVRFPQGKTADGRIFGFTREMLLGIMAKTPSIYASQYLNQPALESQQVITEAQLNAAMVVEPALPFLSRPCLFVDLATLGDDPDDSVIIAGAIDAKGTMHVVDGRGGVWDSHQLACNVIDMANRHRPAKIFIEKTASANYFVDFLHVVCKELGVVLPVDFIKVDNQANAKNIRVQSMAAHAKSGRLKFVFGLPIWEKLVAQTLKFPKDRHGHDDYPDTVALMCQQFGSAYLAVPPPPIATTKHPMVAILDRDPAMQQLDALGKEMEVRDCDLGDGFSC